MELTKKQMEIINNASKIMFCTSSKNKIPRGIYVIPSRIECDKIIISCIQMKITLKNLLENKNVFINIYDNDSDLQIKISGIAELQSNGKLFDEIKNFEESNNLPPELLVEYICVVYINNIEESFG